MCTTSEVKLSRTGRTRSMAVDVATHHGHEGALGRRGRTAAHTAIDDVDVAPQGQRRGGIDGGRSHRAQDHDDRTGGEARQRPFVPVEHGQDLAVVDHGHDDHVRPGAQERRGTRRRGLLSRTGP